jgi:hypothetical protein
MATDMEPVIGNWYYDADDERSFEVIRLEEDEELVEVRYDDGDVEELALDAWYGMSLEPGAPSGDLDLGEEELDDEQFRRASGWGEKNPDDFDERGHDVAE